VTVKFYITVVLHCHWGEQGKDIDRSEKAQKARPAGNHPDSSCKGQRQAGASGRRVELIDFH